MNRFSKPSTRQGGGMMVVMGALLLFLVGFGVLAADIGHIFAVRNELQNAADSAALAGANCLDKQNAAGSSTNCTSAISTTLNWDRATEKARDQLSRNKSDGTALSSTDAGHVIETGYWNLETNGPSGGSFSEAYSPIGPFDKPAVKITVTRDTAMNGGPITMLTAAMFGGSDIAMSAEAVAVRSSPGNVQPASLVPYVINACMYDQFWNSATGTPAIYTGTPADPYNISVVGEPWKFRIGSAYHYGTCQSGQWTSFDQDSDSLAVTRELIEEGNPTALGIGDDVWIQAGTKAAAYDTLEATYPPGSEVTVLVVDTPDLSNKGEAEIVAFAGLRILDVVKAPQKYIEGQFIPSLTTPGSSGIGPFYGVYTPPRLAQ